MWIFPFHCWIFLKTSWLPGILQRSPIRFLFVVVIVDECHYELLAFEHVGGLQTTVMWCWEEEWNDLTCSLLLGWKETGKGARMKAEGPAGQQYSPGGSSWYLGQGGGNEGGEKWLASGHTLREGPRESPDQLDVECGRKRARQAPSEVWGLSKWHLWVKCPICVSFHFQCHTRKVPRLWVAGLPWQRATLGKRGLPRGVHLRPGRNHSIVEWSAVGGSIMLPMKGMSWLESNVVKICVELGQCP